MHSLKSAQNYIMNNINDKRPFWLHEQSCLQNGFAKNVHSSFEYNQHYPGDKNK